MRRQLLLTLFTAATLCLSAADRARETQLQQALDLMQTKGDLTGAIKLLEEVARSTDRNLAARSLLYLGDCRQKLGQQEASKSYERVLRDFADQREVVGEAQRRLAALRQPATGSSGIVTRQVWTGPKVAFEGKISLDGKYLAFPDWDGSMDLAVHDLTTGADRHLTKKDSSNKSWEFAEESTFSRDGKQVAFAWFSGENRYDLRVLDVNAANSKPRVLFTNEEVDWIAPFDWSPDGKSIAVQLQRKDRTAQIGLVSVPEGRLRILKSVDWRGATDLLFSPDGAYLAYDLPVADTDQRDVFLMASNMTKEVPLLTHPADERVLAWTPDGKHLLFASDRSGARGLWALPVNNGRAPDAPVLIKPDIGHARSLGMTRGTLYLGVGSGGQDVHIASVDFQTGKLLSPPAKPIQQFVGTNSMPIFSPDGKYLAYQSRRERSGLVLAIRTLETGQVRELRPQLSYFNQAHWEPGGRSIAVRGTDMKGRQGLYQLDVQTGAVAPLTPVAGEMKPSWAPDGKTLYFRREHENGDVAAIVARDISTGTEREVFRSRDMIQPRLSPDGRRLVMITGSRRSVALIPAEGGEPREIFSLKEGESFRQLEWTRDSQSVIATKVGPGGFQEGNELLLISTTGEPPRKIELNADVIGEFSIHTDGRRIAFTSGRVKREVWAVENFLPLLQAKK